MSRGLRLTSVSIHAPDPRALAGFYARLLDWQVSAEEWPGPDDPPASGWAQLRPPPGETGPTLNFEYEPDYAYPAWPSRPGRQQVMEHLDIAVDDLEASVARAVEAGATLAAVQPQDDVRVLLDPAGHPFCLFLDG